MMNCKKELNQIQQVQKFQLQKDKEKAAKLLASALRLLDQNTCNVQVEKVKVWIR